MKIIVLMGSPNRNGSTGILAEISKEGPKKPDIRQRSLMSVTRISIPVSAA